MTVIVLIRRVARTDKLDQFLEKYQVERPEHEGFISEYLTKVNVDVPSPLRSLDLSTEAGTAFVNVAFWRSEQDFLNCFNPQDGKFDPETEVAPRTRIVLEVTDAAGNLPEGFSFG